MQRFFSAIAQAVRKSIVVVSLISLLSLSGLFPIGHQPAYAGEQLIADNKTELTEATDNREEAYEEAVKEAKSSETVEKTYEEELKEYKESQPKKGLIEEAKEVVEKVTGK